MSEISQTLKNIVLNLLKKSPFLSNKTSLLLRIFRADALGAKVAYKTGFLPDIINVRLPDHINSRKRFRLYTASGKDFIARSLWFFGWHGFEKPLPDVFSACAHKSSGFVIDVGANTGFYSILAIYSSKRIRVHAFEPYLPVEQLFQNNISLNKLKDKICVFACAISDEIGEAEFYVPLADPVLIETSCSLNKEFKEHHSSVIKVPLTTLDQHIKQHAIKAVDILKIDVESLEHKVLKGAINLLQDQRPTIFFELLPSGDAVMLEEIRQSNRYVAIRLRSDLAVIAKEVAYDNLTWNHILVPEEKLEWLQDIFTEIKLNVEKI